MIDPSKPLPPSLPAPQTSSKVSVQSLLENQLKIAGELQELITRESKTLSARDFKDLASSASNLIALAHRTDETLRTVQTYKTFVDVVLEFLRQRSDSLGEDLLEELKEVSVGMRAERVVLEVTSEQSRASSA